MNDKPWAIVCRFGGVGDNLIVSSVLPLLARNYNVEVIAQAPFHVIFENNPHVARLTVRQRSDLPSDALPWQRWFDDRAIGAEMLINLSHSCESMLCLFESQTQFRWPDAWRRKHCGKNYLEHTHDIVGLPYEFDPHFYPTTGEMQRAAEVKRKVGDRYVAWCLSGTRYDKIFPSAALAIARIINELEIPVVMLGAPGKDSDLGKSIHEHVKKHNGTDRNLHLAVSADATKTAPELRDALGLQEKVEAWPIRRVLTQTMMADLVIGPDTGPMWAVAMKPVPKIMLLSHASPENITKHWRNTITLHADQQRVSCWPCHKLHEGPHTCRPNADNSGASCISDISVQKIVSTAAELLTQTRSTDLWQVSVPTTKSNCLTLDWAAPAQ
jgi:ADP-heptose:LPS heptosyltransferase